MKTLIGALFGLYVVELLLVNSGVATYDLAWHPFGAGFEVYQPLTRFAVQGRAGAFSVVVGLLFLYFLLPGIASLLPSRQLRDGLIAGAIGGTLLPLLLGAVFPIGGLVLGWSALVLVLVVLFGLALPEGTLQLFFVIPVSGRLLLWATLAITLAVFLVDRTLTAAEPVGVWLGTYTWWNVLGPGGRRRVLKRKAKDIERELQRFTVIEGGRKDAPQGDQDDWIH